MPGVAVHPISEALISFFCLQNSLNNFIFFSPLVVLPPTDQCVRSEGERGSFTHTHTHTHTENTKTHTQHYIKKNTRTCEQGARVQSHLRAK